ncbi:MAG TPA: hypothetical protein VF876_15280 [Burkholderiales bacterium]
MKLQGAALAILLLAAAPARATGGLELRVADADWGADPARIMVVLEDTARELEGLFPDGEPVKILVSPTPHMPMVLFERTARGEHHVLLRARGSNWAHYAYEFAHELGHILTNYSRHARVPRAAPHQWFEEAVCDMLSVHALRRLAARVPDDFGTPYAGFADLVLGEPHRRAALGLDLAAWLRSNEASLRADPYQRTRNEVVTVRLLDIFGRGARLRALAYLNATDAPPPAEFRDYLEQWRARTPAALQPLVTEVMAEFGFVERQKPPAAVAAGGSTPSY